MLYHLKLKKQLASLVELEPNVLESILNNRSRYAFYATKWNKNFATTLTKQSMPLLNNIELIISNALKNIDWVINYKLPEDIDQYSQEIQELILLLDFINNYDDETIELEQIKQNFQLLSLNLDKIYAKHEVLELTQDEFIKRLDHLLGLSKHKTNKIPRLKMRTNH